MDDPYDVPDSTLNKKAYKEFTLDIIDANNLAEIEKALSKPIDDKTRHDFLEYLSKLSARLNDIRAAEREYEGDLNINVNAYIRRVITLIERLQK